MVIQNVTLKMFSVLEELVLHGESSIEWYEEEFHIRSLHAETGHRHKPSGDLDQTFLGCAFSLFSSLLRPQPRHLSILALKQPSWSVDSERCCLLSSSLLVFPSAHVLPLLKPWV